MTARSYLDSYRTPLGYLLISWTAVYLFLTFWLVFVRNEPFDTALLLGSGLVYALLVAFLLERHVGVRG